MIYLMAVWGRLRGRDQMIRYEYETKYYQEGYDYIIGLDEAGRGPMAGELVVAGELFFLKVFMMKESMTLNSFQRKNVKNYML